MTKAAALYVRLWQDRMGLTDAEAARALRLQNPHKVMHEFKMDRRDPSDVALGTMELLETLSIATGFISQGRITAAQQTLQKTLLARFPLKKFGGADAEPVLQSAVDSQGGADVKIP